jgi:hypothetical protein
MCELSPWSHGPLLRPVHGGLATGIGRRAHRRMARGCYRGRELATGAPRERGVEGNLTVREGGQHGGGARPATMDQNGGGLELVGAGLRARRRGDGVGVGYDGVWRG